MSTAQRESNVAHSVGKSLAGSWEKLLFLASAVVVSYAIGVATGHFRVPPFGILSDLWSAGEDWSKNWRSKLGIEPTQHLFVGRHPGIGVIQNVVGKSSPGVTLLESVFDERVGLRLFDNQGEILHTWPALYSEISPSTDLIRDEDIPTNDWETMIHGSALYPDGDVVFNLAQLALVRMSACGEVEWTLPAATHHSIHIADDGNIWTLGKRYYAASDPRFPGMRPKFGDDLAFEVSPQGEILREISLLEMLYANDLIGAMLPTGHPLIDGHTMNDLLHANDVETLSQEDAPAFPLFEAGDAIVSFRNLNLLIVFDPNSGKVKWSQTGPWLRQHDPDFLPDGRILVLDNRDDGADGRILGGSRLLAIDPVTRKVDTIYEGTPEAPFFTSGRGTANYLDNGNFLVAETQFGRVFEVTPEGEIVWSFVHRYDDERVLSVNGASRYPDSFGRFDRSGC
jgi:hypothetical protein